MCRVNKVTSEETIFVLQIRDKNTASDEGMGRGRVRRKERRRCRGLKLPPAEWRLGQEERLPSPTVPFRQSLTLS